MFTDPEVAWCGLTEADARGPRRRSADGEGAVERVRARRRHGTVRRAHQARVRGRDRRGSWAWASSEPHAGELIAEGTLAVEMGAVAEDLAGTIHTHPTLSETLGEAAELFLGRPIHLPPPGA